MKKRSNLNSETYLFEEVFSAVVIIVATRSERSNCPRRHCHDATKRGNTHAQPDLQAAEQLRRPLFSRFVNSLIQHIWYDIVS